MGGKLRRFLEGAAALGTAALVAACLVWRAQTWAGEKGAGALLFAAGLGVEEASPSPCPGEGGGACAHSRPGTGWPPIPRSPLPQVQTTPDPNRDYAPVEETVIAGGQQVGDFTVKDTTGSGTDLLAELEAPCPVEIQGDGSVEGAVVPTPTPARPTARTSPDFTTRTWPPARRTRSRAWWRWGEGDPPGAGVLRHWDRPRHHRQRHPVQRLLRPVPGRLCSGTWRPTPPSR